MVANREVSTEPLHIRISDIFAKHGEPPWHEWLMTDGRNNAGLICDGPGMENDAHIHDDFNEWWIVLQGHLVWELGDYPPINATKGDVVIAPKGKRHSIKTIGNEPSLRLYINRPDSDHATTGERSNTLEPFPDQNEPPNLLATTLDAMFERFGEPPWSTPLLEDDRNVANLICHGPGMDNNAHWHPDFDEWWTILKGELTWEIGEKRPIIHAKDGDIVFIPRGIKHHITCVGTESSLRLAVTNTEGLHVYTADDKSAPPPRE